MSNLKEEHCALRKENMLLVEGRPGHEAQSLIRYIIAGNSFGASNPSIKSGHEKQGCNSPQLTSRKIFHRSFAGHSNQVSCCRVLSVRKKNGVNGAEHKGVLLYGNLPSISDCIFKLDF